MNEVTRKMKEFFHSVKFKILVGVVALLFGITIFAATTGGSSSVVSTVIGAIVSPVSKLSSNISHKVSSKLDMLKNASDYYDENKQLKKQLNDMYNKMVDYETVKQENDKYKEMLDLKDKYGDYKLSAPCQVIGRVVNDSFQSFFIDKGSIDGIKLHDPVITSGGLIGIVDSVEQTYSRVTTVISNKYPIGVYEINSKDTGLVEGDFLTAKDSKTMMKLINKDSQIAKDDIIVTSGHSGLVPKNLVIGVVEEVKTAENGLSKEAVIKPVEDIKSLTNVFVITSFKGQGEGFNEN